MKTPLVLDGLRILVTRDVSQVSSLSSLLEEHGARPVLCPLISFSPPLDWTPLDRCLARLSLYHGLIFTSANAARFFLSRLEDRSVPRESLERIPCFAVGPATARSLRLAGLSVEPLPESFSAEELCEVLDAREPSGKRFLFPKAREARQVLPAFLEQRGAQVDSVVVYETLKAVENKGRLHQILAGGSLDYVTFTSPSTVESFAEFASSATPEPSWRDIPAACIGEVTAASARSHRFSLVLVAPKATPKGLVEAIARFHQARSPESRGPASHQGPEPDPP